MGCKKSSEPFRGLSYPSYGTIRRSVLCFGQMHARLLHAIEAGSDILALAAGLLRLCQQDLAELRDSELDPTLWPEREALRSHCEQFFEEVDDEELWSEERDQLAEIARAFASKLPEAAIAHAIAEALDVDMDLLVE